jgi:putative transposase
MPRKQRIEYPGAVYHIISRGNYRKELFLKENTGAAFERTLMEAVERWEKKRVRETKGVKRLN